MPEAVPAPSAAAAAAVPGKVAYRRLPGRAPVLRLGLFFVPGGRLYFGPDHLLKIDVGATSETYKRFAFREITAINLVRTSRWHWLTGVALAGLGVIFLIALGVSLQRGEAPGGMMRRLAAGELWPSLVPWLWAAGIAAPSGLLLLTNLLRGPTSRVTLHTALGPELLPTLGRLHVAAPVVREIAAAAEQAQGRLDAGALAARIATALPPG